MGNKNVADWLTYRFLFKVTIVISFRESAAAIHCVTFVCLTIFFHFSFKKLRIATPITARFLYIMPYLPNSIGWHGTHSLLKYLHYILLFTHLFFRSFSGFRLTLREMYLLLLLYYILLVLYSFYLYTSKKKQQWKMKYIGDFFSFFRPFECDIRSLMSLWRIRFIIVCFVCFCLSLRAFVWGVITLWSRISSHYYESNKNFCRFYFIDCCTLSEYKYIFWCKLGTKMTSERGRLSYNLMD